MSPNSLKAFSTATLVCVVKINFVLNAQVLNAFWISFSTYIFPTGVVTLIYLISRQYSFLFKLAAAECFLLDAFGRLLEQYRACSISPYATKLTFSAWYVILSRQINVKEKSLNFLVWREIPNKNFVTFVIQYSQNQVHLDKVFPN